MTHGSHYLGKLYNDLIINSPQTISMDIPSDMGRGRIAQTKIKHGVILSDWQMCYQSDMNVQGPVSKDYMQIIFCLNDGISWGIMDDRRSVTIQKNESCIYAGHGGTEYIHQYVIEQRLAQAAQLLLEGDWNVSEVAAIVGYGKASNFAAAFKKRYGVAPKNYRGSRFDSAKNKV